MEQFEAVCVSESHVVIHEHGPEEVDHGVKIADVGRVLYVPRSGVDTAPEHFIRLIGQAASARARGDPEKASSLLSRVHAEAGERPLVEKPAFWKALDAERVAIIVSVADRHRKRGDYAQAISVLDRAGQHQLAMRQPIIVARQAVLRSALTDITSRARKARRKGELDEAETILGEAATLGIESQPAVLAEKSRLESALARLRRADERRSAREEARARKQACAKCRKELRESARKACQLDAAFGLPGPRRNCVEKNIRYFRQQGFNCYSECS